MGFLCRAIKCSISSKLSRRLPPSVCPLPLKAKSCLVALFKSLNHFCLHPRGYPFSIWCSRAGLGAPICSSFTISIKKSGIGRREERPPTGAVKPVLKKELKITQPVGWHTLRHSLGTLMMANGEDVKTIKETLRHANFKVTMDVYTQGVMETKRNAHSRVVRQIMEVPEGGNEH